MRWSYIQVASTTLPMPAINSRSAGLDTQPCRRVAGRVEQCVRITYASSDLNFCTVSVDLSGDGLLLLTPLCDPPGTLVSVRLEVPDRAYRTLECSVVRLHHGLKPGMGLQFRDAAAAREAFEHCGLDFSPNR